MRRSLRRLSGCLIGLILSISAQALADDTVMLKNGGRVRGSIMSETPTDGVKIRLSDGTVQTIAAADVDHVVYDDGKTSTATSNVSSAPNPSSKPDTSSAPLQQGRLIITATSPGKVFIDGGERGQAPLDIAAINEGTHTIRVAFDAGGSTTTRVSVMANQVTKIVVEQSEGGRAFADRHGVHFGAGAEEMVGLVKLTMIGTRISPFINFGASPGFDLRIAPQLMAGVGRLEKVDDSKPTWSLGGALQLRFNAGSAYTLWFGINAGVWSLNSETSSSYSPSIGTVTEPNQVSLCPFFMAEASPITLRFGEHHEFEVGYTAGVGDLIAPTGGAFVFESTLGVSYLLPSFQ